MLTPEQLIVFRLQEIDKKLDAILRWCVHISNQEGRLMSVLDDLEKEVSGQTTVGDSVVALINNLHDQITAADPNNPRLAAVLATLKANDQRLADLVTQNTPVATPTVAPAQPPAQAPAADAAPAAGDSAASGTASTQT